MTMPYVRIFPLAFLLSLAIGCGGNDPNDTRDGRDIVDAGGLSDQGTVEGEDQGTGDESDVGPSIERSMNSVLPNRVPRTGGTRIRIIGLGFSDDVTLTIGSVRCAELEIQSPTQASCVVPEMTLGRKNLIMRWSATGHVRELVEALEVFEPLTLTDIQPERGHISGGQLAWLGGTGFTETARVFVGGERAEIIRVVDGGRSMRLQVPSGDPGPADVVVENINGRAVLEDGFDYFEPLLLEEVTPRVSGPDGLERVILRGAGLAQSSEVWFGDLQAEVIASLLDRQRLDVRIPPNTQAGLVDVRIENAGGEATLEDGFAFLTVPNEGTIASVQHVLPSRLPVLVFSTIYIGGSGFSEAVRVSMSGRTLACNVESSVLLTCVVSRMTPGTETLTVSDNTTGLFSETFLEFYQSVDLLSITPAYGSQAGGTLVQIEGSGFTESTRFWLGEAEVEVLSVADQVVQGRTTFSQPGLVDLRAENDTDQSTMIGAFEYLDPLITLGGVSGEEITNNLNVTVMDIYTSAPLVDAQVVVQGLTNNQTWRATADERGQVTFGDESLELPVSVTAAMPGYYTETINRVTAEDTTLLLIPTTPPESESGGGQGSDEPPPVIRGRLEGLDGLKKPDQEGMTVAAFIESSTIIDGNGQPINPIPAPYLMLEDGPFEFVVEPGEFAVIGIAGYLEVEQINQFESGALTIEDLRKSLQPIQMGAARHVMVDMGDERSNIVVRLIVPMKEAIAVDFDNPPAGPNGPNRFSLDVVLDLQSDGFYDLRMAQQKTQPAFVLRSLPDLEALTSARFDWTGEAVKVPLFSLGGLGNESDFRTRSTSWVETDRNLAELTIAPFVGTVELGARSMVRRSQLEVDWFVHGGYTGEPTEPADCHFLVLYKNYEPIWISVVPGAASGIELPLLLAGEGVEEAVGTSDELHLMIESYIFSSSFNYRDFNLYDVLGMGAFDSRAFSFGQIQ